MNEWFPPSPYHKNKIELNLNLENYVTQKYLKAVTWTDTSGFATKKDLDTIKAYIKN